MVGNFNVGFLKGGSTRHDDKKNTKFALGLAQARLWKLELASGSKKIGLVPPPSPSLN